MLKTKERWTALLRLVGPLVWSGWMVVAAFVATTVGILVAHVVNAAFVLQPLRRWLEDHDKLAGWFQGIVAILAIFGIYWAATHQTKSERERARENDRLLKIQQLEAVAISLVHLASGYSSAATDFDDDGYISPSSAVPEQFQTAEVILFNFLSRPLEFPDGGILVDIGSLYRTALYMNARYIKEYVEPVPKDLKVQIIEIFGKRKDKVIKVMNDIDKLIEKIKSDSH